MTTKRKYTKKETINKTVKEVAKKAEKHVKAIAKPAVEKTIEVIEPEVKSLWQRFKDWALKLVS
jgi:hypothetical protein